MAVKLVTFGCRLNTYESEVIKNYLQDNSELDNKNVVIFNSCTVTSEAEKQLRQAIRSARKEDPDAIIGVIGCAVQTNKETYTNMEEIDFVFGNKDKMEKLNYDLVFKKRLSSQRKHFLVSDIFELSELVPQMVTGFENMARGFIQIQNGCDNYCTFCATRLARGKSISVPSTRIIDQVNRLVLNGYKEVVLTGIDITDYGKRLNEDMNLGKLMKKILKETDLPRLRLSSIDIADVNDDLSDVLFNEKRMMPHLHISLQSGDNAILKKMARRHNREQVMDFIDELKKHRKNMAVGADLIAGFPTENEEMHKNSCDLIQRIGLVFGHIFPYSVRENTIASTMEQIPMDIRRERAKELRVITKEQLDSFTKEQMKLEHSVLIESEKIGRTENYLVVNLPKGILDNHKIGDLIVF